MNEQNPAEIDPRMLPPDIAVFPLPGVLLLPRGQLPLNIFEPRYLAMVEDALKSHRMIGMIQPRGGEDAAAVPALFATGCAGRITSFEETADGRFLIVLTGVSRFRVKDELAPQRGYRRVNADWGDFDRDLLPSGCLNIDRDRLKTLLENYFEIHGLSCSWEMIDGAGDEKLITALSMICPFDPTEKQALLEAACCRTRAQMFLTMLEMAVKSEQGCCGGGCH